MKFSELVEKLRAANQANLTVHNTEDPEISGVAAVYEATPGTLSYIEGGRFMAQIQTTAATALILPKDPSLQAQATDRGIAWIESSYPRLMFAQAIGLFYTPFKPEPVIHPTAVIDPTAEIGALVAIGAHVVIQAHAKIGNHACIHPNVVVYPAAQVGDRTVLHANCVIHERARIGADCVIHAGAVIGSEGFGFVPTRAGWYKMEQSGYVVLEDGVEIGCNSTIDRPAVGETRIGRNTKLDNLIQVGHGCKIGENCVMAAQVGLAGGVEMGNNVVLAGQVGVITKVKIGDGATISSRTGVVHRVPAGQTVSGFHAVDHKLYLKASAIYSRLPEMYQTLRRLQKRLEEPKDGVE